MVAQHSNYAFRRARMIVRLREMGIDNPAVLNAMHSVPRHLFVEEALRSRAYDDDALPLGSGQTISQPYTVAIMTSLLHGNDLISARHRVLEIGTGCGYQTAVLEKSGFRDIYSIERIADLYEIAQKNLHFTQCLRSRLKCGDGYAGWPQVAPFSHIIVTAAPKTVPLALLKQLAVNGRMVLPLEEQGKQYLWLIEKTTDGYHETCVQEANFVPLVPHF